MVTTCRVRVLGLLCIAVTLVFVGCRQQLAPPSQSTPKIANIPLHPHVGEVRAIAYSPDGHTIASGGDDRNIKLWNADTGMLLADVGSLDYNVQELTFSLNGHYLAAGGGDRPTLGRYEGTPGQVRIWDANTHAVQSTLPLFQYGIIALAFSPDSSTLATLSWHTPKTTSGEGWVGSSGYDNELHLWELDTKRFHWQNSFPGANLYSELAFSPDGHELTFATTEYKPGGHQHRLGSVSYVPRVRILEVQHGTLLHEVKIAGETEGKLALSRDGRELAAPSVDGTIRMIELSSGRVLQTIHDEPIHDEPWRPVALNEKTIIMVRNSALQTWDLKSGSPPRQFKVPDHPWGDVSTVALAPDGDHIAVAGNDYDKGTMTVWQISTGEMLWQEVGLSAKQAKLTR